ncbi:hypothetical protein [Pontiella sulfatireligans]|uniref:EH domain-containing protein n=1 Tax=Pontiella sulfatireligans TaxID=2750658 RepID=A0A6C2UUB9_9BACT|nr:hypothetical protein [Pontiella sulfatireligans]VGO22941.1 hypothetical protein SCARR_05039 [Pontiella sulfatireligans]
MSVNQAVIFTKPVHHLGIDLTACQLDELARSFFEAKGFSFVLSQKVTGPELATREVIKKHYLMYSKAACAATPADLGVSDEGKAKFEAAFGKSWDDEVAAKRIMGTAELLANNGLDVHELFDLWNGLFVHGKTAKIQDGLIMAYIEKLDAYCINAFYPSMEANLYDEATEIDYYVVEFDPGQVSWADFRKKILGATNASNAVPESLRGQLYSEYPVEFPGRDNFVHGSAGPFEGFVERAIHEPDFDMASNPVGQYLIGRGATLESFNRWKATQSVSELGGLFDATEEKNTADIVPILDGVDFA